MKNTKEFIDQLVTIDQMEESNCYGHYPFQLYVEKEDGTIDMNALALGGDVAACYRRAGNYLKEGASKIFMSLDFPASADIEHDFVCIYSYVDNEFKISALPYNTETGEVYPEIHESILLSKIMEQFKSVIK